MSTANVCRGCGKPIGRGGTKCAGCWKAQQKEAREGHVYRNVHVHEWADGHRSIEVGVECECKGDAA